MARNDPENGVGDNLSDGEAIFEVRSGNPAAFEPLVRRYRPALLRTAYARLGNTQSAEDAVQEAFLSAFRSLHTYDSRHSFRSWLWSILINQCRTDYRKNKSKKQVPASQLGSAYDAVIENQSSDNADAAESLIWNESLESIHKLLNDIPTEQAEAIQLRFFGEMKYEEIAHATDCGVTTAKRRVRSGLESISQRLKSQQARPNE